MASPIYTLQQVQNIIACEKVIDETDIEKPTYRVSGPGVFKSRVNLAVNPSPDVDFLSLQFEQTMEEEYHAFSVGLIAKLKSRPEEMIARYDIHAGDHSYPNGLKVTPFQAHRHIYDPARVAAGQLGDWDKSPEVVNIANGAVWPQSIERLRWKMVEDMNIRTNTQQMRMQW